MSRVIQISDPRNKWTMVRIESHGKMRQRRVEIGTLENVRRRVERRVVRRDEGGLRNKW
jgi:hypothetical protein